VGILAQRQDPYGGTLITFSPGAAFVCAIALTLLVATLIGWPSLRLRGHYLAMATLGFGLIVYRILLGAETLGAADGIAGVPPWPLGFGLAVSGRKAARVANYYIAWGFSLLVLLFLLNLVKSRVGRALRAIHGGETAANAMGVNTAAWKLRAFVLSALLASAAGSFLTHYNGGIGPSEAGAMKSVRYVALVAAGGMANIWGVLAISAILNFLSLRGCFGTFDHAVFGAILILIMSLAPDGPLAPIARGLRRLFNRASAGAVANARSGENRDA
jgi:branched-chain amino acid transport system permease protein